MIPVYLELASYGIANTAPVSRDGRKDILNFGIKKAFTNRKTAIKQLDKSLSLNNQSITAEKSPFWMTDQRISGP